MRYSNARLVAGLAVALAIALAGPAPAAVEPDASIGYGEGNRAGNVTLVLNGISQASAFGLELDEESGHYTGTGRVDYEGQGLSIHDDAATFYMDLAASPSLLSSCTFRVPLLASWIRIVGSKGAFTIETDNRRVEMTPTTCPRVLFAATIDGHPKARGTLKKNPPTITGRILKK